MSKKSHPSDDGNKMDSFGFVIERFCQPNDSLVRKVDLEGRLGLVLDEVLHLAVHVRVGIASQQTSEDNCVDSSRLKMKIIASSDILSNFIFIAHFI